MWFTKSLTAVLAVSFVAVVKGQNSCFTGLTSQCTSGRTEVELADCNLTDADLADLDACFETIGRNVILELDLSDNAFTTIPSDLFDDMTGVTILRLDDNAIATLPADRFTGMTSLEILWLDDNGMTTIDDDAFSGLGTLKQLFLENNMLTTIQAGLFDSLGSLTRLKIERNEIATIEEDAFVGLTSIETMWVFNNKLTSVQAGRFDNLVSLDDLRLNNNNIATIDDDAFMGSTALITLKLDGNELTTVQAGLFEEMESLEELLLDNNNIGTIDDDAFAGLTSLVELNLERNMLPVVQAGLFDGLVSLEELKLNNMGLTTIEEGAFDTLGKVEKLYLQGNQLDTLPSNGFADMASIYQLLLDNNGLTKLPADAFVGLLNVQLLFLDNNELTTLPAGVFEPLGSETILRSVHLNANPGLQCIPTVTQSLEWTSEFYESIYIEPLPATAGMCECTPEDAVMCDAGTACAPGAAGYTCEALTPCTVDSDCDTVEGEICCPVKKFCEVGTNAGACGDPHMTGFRGQKFDFMGKDDAWYALVSDLPFMHLNMRVTSPVPSVPEITYITGISIITTDSTGLDHTIVVTVADPHNMESSCPVEMLSCLADGALHVVINGEEGFFSPGELTLGPDVAIAAVNLPGACRSFGFETYWERKKLEQAHAGRWLSEMNGLQDMSEWVLSDPTATNMVECAEYVEHATAVGGTGVFAHQSEHASFQIVTPAGTIRLNHGRLQQLLMRDATDQFDLPDHLTWQMNIAVDHNEVSLGATGILGETTVPKLDSNGFPILQGMDSIRGAQEDYRVKGPLDVVFSQGQRLE